MSDSAGEFPADSTTPAKLCLKVHKLN